MHTMQTKEYKENTHNEQNFDRTNSIDTANNQQPIKETNKKQEIFQIYTHSTKLTHSLPFIWNFHLTIALVFDKRT